MSRPSAPIRHVRRLAAIAFASAMLVAQPATALADTLVDELFSTAYQRAMLNDDYYYDSDYYDSESGTESDSNSEKTEDASVIQLKLEASYPYTGGPVEPKPLAYISLSHAYDLGFIGSSFTRGEYNKFLEDNDGYKYYHEHYFGTPEYDERLYDKSEDQEIDDVFEILDILTEKSKFFTYYNIKDDYFDWLNRGEVILDPTDNRGFVYRLTEGNDYTLTYENNIGPGAGLIVVKGEHPIVGKAEHKFNIGTVNQAGYERVAGSTRYDTMAEISARNFTRPCAYAVVATGQNFPDALSASSLAGAYQAPVILTETNSLSPQARTQLSNLGVTNVFLMGGTSAVGTGVENDLKQMGISVTRIAGDGRVGTSLRAMQATFAGGSTSDTVIIATGYQFADSLSIGSWAYASKAPIVLTNQDGLLTDDAVRAIRDNTTVTRIVIVGGTAAVSDSVRNQLSNAYTFERLSGSNRYETSARIAEWLISSKQFGINAPLVATGANFPDALAGAPFAGKTKQPILLVSQKGDATVNTLVANKSKVTTFFVLGGEGAVSKSLADDIAASLR